MFLSFVGADQVVTEQSKDTESAGLNRGRVRFLVVMDRVKVLHTRCVTTQKGRNINLKQKHRKTNLQRSFGKKKRFWKKKHS